MIYKETKNLLIDEKIYLNMANTPNPYGDGKASQRIIEYCEKFLKK